MSRAGRIAVGVVAVVLVAGGLWIMAQRTYFSPRAEKLERIAELEDRVKNLRGFVARRETVRDARDAYVALTLGGTQEVVDAALRSRLNRLYEAVDLDIPSVTTGRASTRLSPARRKFRASSMRALRDAPDFVELEAAVGGEGTLAQIVELIDRIDAEPWLKRLDGIRLIPRDNGERMGVRVNLTTLYIPGETAPGGAAEGYDRARLTRYEPLLAQNPFRVPPPPAPPAPPPPVAEPTPAPPPAAPASPPAFPWADWRVSAIFEMRSGAEVWLRRQSNGEKQVLFIGERLGSARLERVENDTAFFVHDDARFSVRVGDSMEHTNEAEGS